jgi:hypothetical protein
VQIGWRHIGPQLDTLRNSRAGRESKDSRPLSSPQPPSVASARARSLAPLDSRGENYPPPTPRPPARFRSLASPVLAQFRTAECLRSPAGFSWRETPAHPLPLTLTLARDTSPYTGPILVARTCNLSNAGPRALARARALAYTRELAPFSWRESRALVRLAERKLGRGTRSLLHSHPFHLSSNFNSSPFSWREIVCSRSPRRGLSLREMTQQVLFRLREVIRLVSKQSQS